MQDTRDIEESKTTPARDRDAGDAPGGGGDASDSAAAGREGGGGGGGGGGGDASVEASAPKRQRMGGKNEAELLA